MSENTVPEGLGVVRTIGWMVDEDTKQEVFRAYIDFPSGPPDLQYRVVFQQIPVRLTAVEDAAPSPQQEQTK